MKSVLTKFLNTSFFKSVSTLVSGSIVAQIITVVASILLARIFTPDELGIYTLILTAESLFGSVICLRYDVSIVSEKNDRNVYGLIKLSFLITTVLSIVISVIYWYVYIWNDIDYHNYSYMLIFIVLMLFIRGLLNIFEAYNNRHGEYVLMTKTYVTRTVVQNLGSILLGLLNFGVFGIVLSHTLGNLFGMRIQANRIIDNKNEINSISNSRIIELAKENYKQPVYSSPAIFANRYSYSSISLFISQLFGPTVLGFYSISYKALGLPLTVVSNNVSKVFFKEASKEYSKKGEFINSFIKISFVLILLAIPFGLIVYFLTPITFNIILGSAWLESAKYVQILIPMFCVRLVVNTIATGLQIVNKQNIELLLQMMLVGASVLSYFVVNLNNFSVDSYLSLITISFSIIYIIYYLVVFKYSLGEKTLKDVVFIIKSNIQKTLK